MTNKCSQQMITLQKKSNNKPKKNSTLPKPVHIHEDEGAISNFIPPFLKTNEKAEDKFIHAHKSYDTAFRGRDVGGIPWPPGGGCCCMYGCA